MSLTASPASPSQHAPPPRPHRGGLALLNVHFAVKTVKQKVPGGLKLEASSLIWAVLPSPSAQVVACLHT